MSLIEQVNYKNIHIEETGLMKNTTAKGCISPHLNIIRIIQTQERKGIVYGDVSISDLNPISNPTVSKKKKTDDVEIVSTKTYWIWIQGMMPILVSDSQEINEQLSGLKRFKFRYYSEGRFT